jgi:DNA adenine methylase
MAGAVSRWLGSHDDLAAIAQRLLRVQIEHAPAVEVIERYDSAETLFYCDPPYVHDTRGDSKAYAHEMTDADHRQLAAVLHRVEGKVALSGYHGPLYEKLYGNWFQTEAPEKLCHSVKQFRREVLWTNYDPSTLTAPLPLAGADQWRLPAKSSMPLFDEPKKIYKPRKSATASS